MWPGAADSAWSALRRWPDAIAIKKTVLMVTSLSEASARGSKGAFPRASNTPGRLHAGRRFRAGNLKKGNHNYNNLTSNNCNNLTSNDLWTLSCDLEVRHNVKVPIVHLWSKFGCNRSEPVHAGAIWKRATITTCITIWRQITVIIWPPMTFDLVMWPQKAS